MALARLADLHAHIDDAGGEVEAPRVHCLAGPVLSVHGGDAALCDADGAGAHLARLGIDQPDIGKQQARTAVGGRCGKSFAAPRQSFVRLGHGSLRLRFRRGVMPRHFHCGVEPL